MPDVEIRLHGDVAELGLQLGDLGLLLGDGLLGGGDVLLELAQLVEGDVVLLGEPGGLLLERLDHVGVLLDLAALVVDRIGRGDAGAGEGGDEDGDSGRDEAGETGRSDRMTNRILTKHYEPIAIMSRTRRTVTRPWTDQIVTGVVTPTRSCRAACS